MNIEIIKSKRKTLAIEVKKDLSVIVSAPLFNSNRDMQSSLQRQCLSIGIKIVTVMKKIFNSNKKRNKEKAFNIKKFLKRAKKYDPFEINAFEEAVRYFEKDAEKVNYKKLGLKLIVISDSHGNAYFEAELKKLLNSVDSYDLVIILGDVSHSDLDIITGLVPEDKIIGLLGNHDEFNIYAKYGIYNLNGKIYSYKGVKFAGIEGSFRYKNEKFPSFTHYESLHLAYKMSKADVLLSHDGMFAGIKGNNVHSGLLGITHYIFNNAVKWHIHGHLHSSYQKEYSNGTIEKSVYMCEIIDI